MLINLDMFYLLFISCIRFVVFVYRLVNKVDHFKAIKRSQLTIMAVIMADKIAHLQPFREKKKQVMFR